MQWNLRLRAAERGIWKSAQMRRMLADAGLEISAGKMSSWWAGTPPTMRLEELDVLCAVLECTPNDLMSLEPDKVAARRPRATDVANGNGGGDDDPDGNGGKGGKGGDGGGPVVAPRFGKPRSRPPL
ncbi:helix-turn-helix domain-containing protein [Nocardioides soli]|jgi:DNA-binding Xre family transcriptional regulator|uniref:DNA-binding Xre family transcriptional regulator n=1 Tax=Nocardioides soli TaxID=1036020 RepID=A0A7W4VX12_9ACTN|nr:helix-turn-helix transcriptional regulator [Nocardioides soli]MBB3043391.1 DNA-binding Xre family transcriptional regulator [Nocardioides soli]